MIDQCVIETVEGGFPEVNKYVHASCSGCTKTGSPGDPNCLDVLLEVKDQRLGSVDYIPNILTIYKLAFITH